MSDQRTVHNAKPYITMGPGNMAVGPGNAAVGKSRVIIFSNHLFTHLQLHYVPPENVISDNKVNG